MDLRRGMVWGSAITLLSGVITFIYLRSITIDDGLEALIFIPITGVLFALAGALGGWRGRTGMWIIGLSLGSGALLIIVEVIWLVVWLLTRQPITPGNEFTDGMTLFSITALAGFSTVGTLFGLSLALSLSGWLPAHWMRGRTLRR